MVRYFICCILFLVAFISLDAQSFEPSQIVFEDINGLPFANKFTGSMVAPQFSQIDMNFDEKLDLFVFDRSNNEVFIFLNTGDVNEVKYEYAPNLTNSFPELTSWALLRDYNNDGLYDLFTSSANKGISSITVYTGRKINGQMSFVEKEFDLRLGNVLHHLRSDGKFYEIYVSVDDLPAIYDVDGDGDLDVLNFEIGGSVLNFYRNLVVENELSGDTLLFDLGEFCYGGLSEDPLNSDILLSDTPGECTFSFRDEAMISRHAGASSVSAFDHDGDGDTDLLIGDELTNNIIFLNNDNTSGVDWMSFQNGNFPNEMDPSRINFFLGSYILDVNNDGLEDLIFSPNTSRGRQNKDHVWLYINEGTKTEPDYNLLTKNFLHENHMTFYSGSHPTFTDVDGDGLIDMVVGTNGTEGFDRKRKYSMYYLKNTGSISLPKFSILDEDFLNYSTLGENSGRFAPHFGDIDGDGDKDLLVGDKAGFLYFQNNIAGANEPMDFEFAQFQYKDIFIGSNAKPILFDFDEDGLMDLIIGDQNNELNFIKNIGDESNPDFDWDLNSDLNTKELGLFFPHNQDAAKSGSPFIVENGPRTYLYFGQKSGDIRRFDIISRDLTTPFEEKLLEYNFHIGKNATIAFADIDDDQMYELAVGSDHGGLSIFETNIYLGDKTSILVENVKGLSMAPNPINDYGILSLPTDEIWDYSIFDFRGVLVSGGKTNNQTRLDLSDLISGLYVMKVKSKNRKGSIKFTVIK